MYRLFLTPEWFQGMDILFETVGLAAAFLIAAYAWRAYLLNKENRFFYFSLAFVLVGVSLLFKIFSSGVLYYTPIRDTVLDVLRPTVGQGLRYTNLYYGATFFLQVASLLGGWLLLFFVSQKPRPRLSKFDEVTQIALFGYLILLISAVAQFKHEVFYITASVLLALIVLNYYRNYVGNGHSSTYQVMLAFLFILIGHLFFVFIFVLPGLYVIGQLFLLAGFITLLYTQARIVGR